MVFKKIERRRQYLRGYLEIEDGEFEKLIEIRTEMSAREKSDYRRGSVRERFMNGG
jgi:hypothetical protein